MSELKQCPFCGSEDVSLWSECNRIFYVKCNNCLWKTENFPNEKQAAEIWNKRAKTACKWRAKND